MTQIPDHPFIRLMETQGVPDDPACCETCRWYYEDEHMCCGTNREPIWSPSTEVCDSWEADDE